MPLGARVKYHRERLGMTLEELEAKSGVKHGTISALENRDSEMSKFSAALAAALGMTEEQLKDVSFDGISTRKTEDRQQTDSASVSTLGLYRTGAGPGKDAEQPIDQVPISTELCHALFRMPPKHLDLFRVEGPSMRPTFDEEDIVAVDKRVHSFMGSGVYLLYIPNEGVVLRRLVSLLPHGRVRLTADNPLYSPNQEVDPHRDLDIRGKAVGKYTFVEP